MLKGEMLVGKAVIAYETGQQIDRIQGVLVDHYANRLAAFWVSSGARKHLARVLPWSGVKAVEPKRVVAWSVNMLVHEQDLFSIRRLLERDVIRPGTRFETTDQQDLGTMGDFYFDENTGALEGYEVAGGIFAENAADHGFLPATSIVSIGNGVALLPASIVRTMQEQPVEPEALLEQIKPQVKPEERDSQDQIVRHVLGHVRGLRVRHPVFQNDGILIAAQGQIITLALIQRAQLYQAERQIIEAVGIDLDNLLREIASSTKNE